MTNRAQGSGTSQLTQRRRKAEAMARVLTAMREQVSGHELDADAEAALQELADVAAERIINDAAASEPDLTNALQAGIRRLRASGELTTAGIRRVNDQVFKQE
jgi:diaminopimelate decarboxylase